MVEDDLYRIGAVARLTGISVECLRAWERRYGLVPAERAGRTRYYSYDQVQRLGRIKALIDAGHAVSSLIDLSDAQLESRARAKASAAVASPHRLPQVGLVGTNLVLLEQDGPDSNAIEVAQRWITLEDFIDARERERSALDVVALQLPTLDFSDLDRAQRAAPDCRFVIIYRYAARDALASLAERGMAALSWPLGWPDLERACATPVGTGAASARTAPRRFSDHELVAIASRAREAHRDAPRQLVGLITDLNAFVDHAAQRVVSDSAEAHVYEQLRSEASFARAQLERALAIAASSGE